MPRSPFRGAREPGRADRAILAESNPTTTASAAAAPSPRFPLIDRSNSTGTVSSSESFDLHSIRQAPSQQVRVVNVPQPQRVRLERRSNDLVRRSLSPDFVAPLVFTDRPAETQSSLRFVQRVQSSRQSTSTLIRRRSSLALDTTASFQPEFVLHQPSPIHPGIGFVINYRAELCRHQTPQFDSAVDENTRDFEINQWLSQRVSRNLSDPQPPSEEASLHSNPPSFVLDDDQPYQQATESSPVVETDNSSFGLRRRLRRSGRPTRLPGFRHRFTEPATFPEQFYEDVETSPTPPDSPLLPLDEEDSLDIPQTPRKRV
jgi:hypothetical protein